MVHVHRIIGDSRDYNNGVATGTMAHGTSARRALQWVLNDEADCAGAFNLNHARRMLSNGARTSISSPGFALDADSCPHLQRHSQWRLELGNHERDSTRW